MSRASAIASGDVVGAAEVVAAIVRDRVKVAIRVRESRDQNHAARATLRKQVQRVEAIRRPVDIAAVKAAARANARSDDDDAAVAEVVAARVVRAAVMAAAARLALRQDDLDKGRPRVALYCSGQRRL